MEHAQATGRAVIGRFAPSPTGPLHFGSLVAAVGSYLDARSRGGQWLVRMEDLDLPRVVPGAADFILQVLDRFGFEWDGPVLYQSNRMEAYHSALQLLREKGIAYPCGCSRKEIGEQQRYPGTCRAGLPAGKGARAWRLRVDPHLIHWQDRLQGAGQQDLQSTIGDFVLLRADGIFAYQLAVVVDDAFQQVNSIVRGADLLDSIPRQIYLQRQLALPLPEYLHLPVAVNAHGEKLSKQTKAPALNDADPASELWQALKFLGQNPPSELCRGLLPELWRWALRHWNTANVPAQGSLRWLQPSA